MIIKRIGLIVAGLCFGAVIFAQDKIDTFGDDKRTFRMRERLAADGASLLALARG